MQPAIQDSPNPSKYIGVGLVGAILLIGIIGLGAAGLLRFTAPPSKPVLPVVTSEPTPTLKRPATDQMPDDIRAWLNHLEAIERQRIDLAQEQVRNLTRNMSEFQVTEYANTFKDLLGGDPTEGEITPTEGVQKAGKIAEGVRPAWAALTRDFNAKGPPDECQPIADNYDQALRETGATVGDIIDILYGLGGSPQEAIGKLEGIMSKHKDGIDKKAVEADKQVQAICDKYGTRKWFTIKGDIGSGGMLSMPTLPDMTTIPKL